MLFFIEKTLKELIIELNASSKTKDIFLASMSHEIRNPLNSLLGCIELLSQNADEKDKDLVELVFSW